MDTKFLKKDGTLLRKYLLRIKSASLRMNIKKVNIINLAKNLATKNGSFHKVRAWEASKDGNAFVTVGKKDNSFTIAYGSDNLRNAMRDADYLNIIIKSMLTPEIPQDAIHCPKCGGEDISWDRLEADGNSASQGGFCTNCHARWATVFKFTHNEILN